MRAPTYAPAMRAMLLAVVVLVIGCGGEGVRTPDARPPSDLPPPFGVRVGEDCGGYDLLLCDRGVGACVESTCRAQCSAVSYPRCQSGFAEQHIATDSGDLCVCAPLR